VCGLAAPEGISLLIAFRRHVGPPVVRTRDIHIIRISVIFVLGRTSQTTASLRLKFHANSVLVASWLHPCEDVRNTACVSGSWNLENDTTHGRTGSDIHRSGPPADQSGKRVASRTGKSPDILARILERMSVCRACRRKCNEDATRKLLSLNFSLPGFFEDESMELSSRYTLRQYLKLSSGISDYFKYLTVLFGEITVHQ